MANDLIAAVATPPGAGSIGIVRLSGPGLPKLAGKILSKPAKPGAICRRSFVAGDGSDIDSGIALLFAGPHSYTGEDVLELQGHGGSAVMARLLRRCLELGARLAEPGEFTRRAYLNGRINLAQAEGIADLIGAATERAAKLAAAAAGGALAKRAAELAHELRAIRAQCEAAIDFADEDVDPQAGAKLQQRIRALAGQAAAFADKCRASLVLRQAARIALIGPPNSGKSSLLNILAGKDAAIVSAEAGTTRDLVECMIGIDGLALQVTDTAGLRAGGGEIEREGMRRAIAAAQEADAVAIVHDATAPDASLPAGIPQAAIKVINKIDLTGEQPGQDGSVIRVSAKTGAGMDDLREALANRLGGLADDLPALARERHVDALRRAAGLLEEAAAAPAAAGPEIAAELLRAADNALGEIAGRTVPDDVLGAIFSQFCIGK